MRLHALALVVLAVIGCRRGQEDDGTSGSNDSAVVPTGIFVVTRTTMNPGDCETEGAEVAGDVHFFSVDDAIRDGYRATTCGGTTEPDCPTRDSYLGESVAGGWQQLDFFGAMQENGQGDVICSVSASLLRVTTLGSDEVRYETAQWEAEPQSAPDACSTDLARAMYEAGELDCVGHTTRTGTLQTP